jgi:hypothetical protein
VINEVVTESTTAGPRFGENRGSTEVENKDTMVLTKQFGPSIGNQIQRKRSESYSSTDPIAATDIKVRIENDELKQPLINQSPQQMSIGPTLTLPTISEKEAIQQQKQSSKTCCS